MANIGTDKLTSTATFTNVHFCVSFFIGTKLNKNCSDYVGMIAHTNEESDMHGLCELADEWTRMFIKENGTGAVYYADVESFCNDLNNY
jgi:hypothetical protein